MDLGVLVEPEKNPADFRLAIEYIPVNAATVPLSWLMPEIDNELSDVNEAVAFCEFRFFHRLFAVLAPP